MSHPMKRIVASVLVCGVISGAATTALAGAPWPPNVNPYCAKNRPVVVAYTLPSWNSWANGGCFKDITAALVWAQYWSGLGNDFTYAFKVNGIWSKAPGAGGVAQNGGPTQDYMNRIKQIGQQAVEAKKYAIQHVGKLTNQQFDKINGLIGKYNKVRVSAQSKYSSYFPSSKYPYISPVPSSWKAPTTAYTLEYRSASCSWCRWSRLNWTSTSLSVAYQAKNWASRNYPQYSFRVAFQ